MPHEMQRHDTMVSANGIIPWHRLGTIVPGDIDYDDVLRLAGLDWEVELQPLYAGPGMARNENLDQGVLYVDGAIRPVENYRAVIRRDLHDRSNDRVISVVGSDYAPLQNSHGLEFLRILMDAGDIQVETAGSLRDNRIVWVCARMDRNITIDGDETVPYLIFSTSHDGSMAAGVTAGPVRVVCANTLRMSDLRAVRSWRTVHVGDIRRRVAEARAALAMGSRFYDAFEAEVEALMAQQVTDQRFTAIVNAVVPTDDSMTERQIRNRGERREMIRVRWIGQPGTAWAALNAVNGYELWDRRVRGADEEQRTTQRAHRQALNVLRGRQPLTDLAHRMLTSVR